jgi:hypothetical protein
MGPYLVFVGTFGAFLVFRRCARGRRRPRRRLLYGFAVTSLSWSACSCRVGLELEVGALRGRAQRRPARLLRGSRAVALMTVMLQAGTLSTQAIVGAQGACRGSGSC